MAEVNLWSGLRQFTDGELVVHPKLEPIIEAGVSVSVDGEMTAGADHTPIQPNSEIFLLQQFKGG
jgi:hypothetical protein